MVSWCKKILFSMAFASLLPFLFGFVLLSGPREATLDVKENAPVAVFVVGDKTPKFSGKGSFMGGQYANLSDEEFYLALVQEAMNVWNDVYSSYLVMEAVRSSGADLDEGDEIHSIVVGDVNLSSSAFARPNIEDDKIIDCDIQVGKKKTAAKDLALTMLHELGHCIGLGHNHSNYGSIMGYSHDSSQFKLGADDIAGITYLYPDSDVVEDKPKELILGSCGTINKNGKWQITSLIFMLLPLFWLLRLEFQPKILHIANDQYVDQDQRHQQVDANH